MHKVTVVGSLNIDHLLSVSRLPARGETVLAGGHDLQAGGKGANQAAAAGKLGVDVSMIGKVGRDKPGEIICSGLAECGVNTAGVIVDPDELTGAAFITVDGEGRNTIVVVPGANGRLSVADIESRKETLLESDIFVLQMEISLDTIAYVINTAKEFQKTVILNYAPAVRIDKSMLSAVDYLVVNETEFSYLAGNGLDIEDIRGSAARLRDFFSRTLVVTLGENGSIAMTGEGEIIKAPGYTVEAVDTTGAGDAFIGGFVSALAADKSMAERLAFGNVAGALAVTRPGAQPSLPWKHELDVFLQPLG